ncbi:MAG: M20/M25/M40 family metallo-hydrolase [Chloroflexi bacterium]|nr:M20/M25/M40 family metallo-hydrolase [Chloroflexota bacterium]
MSETKSFLKEMITAPGLSGHEKPVREIIEKRWAGLVDETHVSPLGSLEGLKKGSGTAPRKSVMLAGHMDAIGLIVTGINGEFLRITDVGGVDPRVMPGQPVTVYGREILKGVVVQPPDRLVEGHPAGTPMGLDKLYVDVGLEAAEVAKKVRAGDLVTFGQMPLELGDDILSGHTMDDRAAVAAITCCLEILKKRFHQWDVWAVATVQEEVGLKGAMTSAFGLEPTLGIAIDVTHAKGPGTSEKGIADLGKGMVLGMGPNIHPWMYKKFKEIADELEIPYQVEMMAGHSGTDAYALQVARGGRPTMVLSIPLRYMHTPVETVSMKDIERAGRLLAEFITWLGDENTADIRWED